MRMQVAEDYYIETDYITRIKTSYRMDGVVTYPFKLWPFCFVKDIVYVDVENGTEIVLADQDYPFYTVQSPKDVEAYIQAYEDWYYEFGTRF